MDAKGGSTLEGKTMGTLFQKRDTADFLYCCDSLEVLGKLAAFAKPILFVEGDFVISSNCKLQFSIDGLQILYR